MVSSQWSVVSSQHRKQRLGSPSEVGRGERDEAHGGGRRARRGSRYARQGAVLCKETSEAAISRVVRRRSRVPRIDDAERESVGNVDRGRAPRHERATDTARVPYAACFAAVSGAQSRENEASCAGARPAAVYVYSKRSRYAQIARCRGRATLRRNMPHVGKQGKGTAEKSTESKPRA